MDSDTIPELSHILLHNLHFFLPVFFMFSVEIAFSSYHIQYQEVFSFEYSTLLLILLLVSIPLSVLNPPVWFTLYMTTFIHMLHFKELYIFAITATVIMFISIFYHEAKRIRRRSRGVISEKNGLKLKTS